MDDDVDAAKLSNMMVFIQLFNVNRTDYNPDAWRECWENRRDMTISEILNILKSCFHDTNAQYYSGGILHDNDNPVWINWLCMITASLDPVKQPETVKACMYAYDSFDGYEFTANDMITALEIMNNGYPMEYAIECIRMEQK